MSSPNPYTKHPSPPRSTVAALPSSVSPIGGGILCKSVLLGMFLLALPLFPSQAPNFVGETVLTKFWELIHLLFVGIAVAYGLFSRRNVESSNVELRMSCVDESSLSYVSRILQVSSVFNEEEEEEVENPCSFVDVRSDKIALASVEERNQSEYGEINQVQSWSSQYFQGRSKVVVARPAYGHVVHQSLGLPVRSLRSALRDRDSAALEENEKAEEDSLAAPSSPWHSSPEMIGMEEDYSSNFQPLSVDETRFTTRSSRSSVSSQTSVESHDQNRHSPSRSVSGGSLNSNVEEKSLQGSSRSSSPSLPPSPSLRPSPSLSPSPPSPELVTDETHRRVLHSRHCSDGSLLEEGVRQGFEDEVRGFSKKEPGSQSLKLTAESSRKEKNKSRRSYPPDLISSPDHSTTGRRYLQQKSDSHLLESGHNKLRVKKGRSHDSLELTTVNSLEFQPTNDKPSRRLMRSSRGGSDKDNKRNSDGDDDSEDYDKSRKRDLPGDNKEVRSNNSPRCEPQSRRGSSEVPSRGKSVRTIRSDRSHGDSSDDRAESHGRTKPRRQWQQELAIVLHQEKHSEPEDDDDDDVTEETDSEAELPQETLEEEEVAAWESQSNEHYEVDRKADEFIAKFREQIRLQKLHSGEQRRGGGTGVIRNRHFR
ncbi:unnamed protein product [Eruca vesicaria subsp. sativa]|uniref:Uncharacterized protein n=1 Tax=Eruca vesicaria subsp. sativa TaxID=29727 RepID=A0ABC8IZQ1_ERUVS|nr:unnamed protein product [Eruca vesicaria subsp. sativa]